MSKLPVFATLTSHPKVSRFSMSCSAFSLSANGSLLFELVGRAEVIVLALSAATTMAVSCIWESKKNK